MDLGATTLIIPTVHSEPVADSNIIYAHNNTIIIIRFGRRDSRLTRHRRTRT